MAKFKKVSKLPKTLLRRIQNVKAKRPRTVLEHLLKHGSVTTEELQNLYGYEHPPRAARDVRELGIPLVTSTVSDSRGRKIAAYRLDPHKFKERGERGGRERFPKALKTTLVGRFGAVCAVCGGKFDAASLQIDHKIPYEVSGPANVENPGLFMLLCGSCNRAKSWSCEHCMNWSKYQRPEVCGECYWGSPLVHIHIAMEPIRRLDLVWQGAETADFDLVKALQEKSGSDIRKALKSALLKIGQSNKAD